MKINSAPDILQVRRKPAGGHDPAEAKSGANSSARNASGPTMRARAPERREPSLARIDSRAIGRLRAARGPFACLEQCCFYLQGAVLDGGPDSRDGHPVSARSALFVARIKA